MGTMRVLLMACIVAAVAQIAAAVPYSEDAHTLHLYHFDGDAIDSVTTDPIDLVLDSGATATDASTPGLGQALNTYEGTATTGTNLPSAMAAEDTPISNFVGADGAFTFEAVVCPAFDLGSIPNHMQIISGDHDSARGWHFRVESGGNLVFTKLTGTIQDDMRTPVPSTGPHAFAANKWFHVAVTYNGQENTDGNLKLYWTALDSGATEAVLLGSFNLTADLNPTVAPSFVIGNEGRSGNGRTENWEGWIDEVRISDIARSPSEMIPRVIMPTGAATPVPADGAVDVLRDQVLSWKSGVFAATHNVYFGTTRDDVEAASTTDALGATVGEGLDANSYDPPGLLTYGQTYYWRVDEVNAAPDFAVYKGDVWSFTAEPYTYRVADVNATSSIPAAAGSEVGKIVDGSGLTDDGGHSTDPTTMWQGNATAGDDVWVQFEFHRTYKIVDMRVWNFNHLYESFLGFGLKDVTVVYSTDGDTWTTLGDFVFDQATSVPTYKGQVIAFGGVPAQYVRFDIHSNRSLMGELKYGLSEVQFNYLPVFAREPKPASGATDVDPDVVLSWRAGREAASHEIYLGPDEQTLALEDTIAAAAYDPDTLDLGTTYFWSVTEVNEAETPSAWEGDVWNFSTPDYLVVDDFEAYTEEEGELIYDVWLDGFDIPANGSQVGHDDPPFVEQTIVHSGRQSMPLYYGQNGATVSTIDRTFEGPQDWTRAGAQTLVIYFRGNLGNAAGQLYVEIDGARRDYSGNAASLAAPLWKQWNIDLTSLGAGTASVRSLVIGISGTGSGLLYIDDIRLYRTAPPMVGPAVDPGAGNLVALYAMEDNANDGSGNGRDGTAEVGSSFGQGPAGYGRALVLDGASGYVSLPIGSLVQSMSSTTVATWVNWTGSGSWQRIFDFGSDTNAYMFLTPNSGSGTLRFSITTGGSSSESLIESAPGLTEGWHHVAVAIDGAAGQMQLYLDGQLVDSGATATLPLDLGNTTQNWIGRSQYGTDAYFSGSVDDFRIYNRALSEAEVRYLVGDG